MRIKGDNVQSIWPWTPVGSHLADDSQDGHIMPLFSRGYTEWRCSRTDSEVAWLLEPEGLAVSRADIGKGYTRSLNLQPRAAPTLPEWRRNNSAKGADAAESRLVLPSLPLVPSTTDGWVVDWEHALPHLSGGGTWVLNYLFSPWWQPHLTGQSAAQSTGFPTTEMSVPPKGVLKLCKLSSNCFCPLTSLSLC